MYKQIYTRILVITGVIAVAFLLYLPDTRSYLNSVLSAVRDNCKTKQTTTFIKSYRLKDKADAYGITQTADGAYVITGRTINPNEMKGFSMFWIKADANGNRGWSKLFNNGASEGRAIAQLTDGNYVAAGEVSGEFMTDSEEEQLEAQGDNLVVKLSDAGNIIWTRTVSQRSNDGAFKLLPNAYGGFVMSGLTGKLTGKPDVADVNHTLFLGNFDVNGETNWLKKIEGSDAMVKSVQQAKDGGYIMIGNIKLVQEHDQKVPALVKLKPNGTYEWATGLENLPIEVPNLIMNPDKKGFTVGTPNKMHLAFGDFLSAKQTDDGGYIALGRYFSAISTAELAKVQENAFKESSFVAVKVDAKGVFKWARVITAKRYLEDAVIEKTRDGGYIIMGNNVVGEYTGADTVKRGAAYQKLLDDYYAKYPIASPETPESKKALEKLSDEISAWQSGLRLKNIVLIKTDGNFKYQWGKTIGGKGSLEGHALVQTPDFGYAVAGTWYTGIKYKLLGSWMEYTEAMIMKLDANGNLGNGNGLVADFADTESSDVSSYVVTNKLNSPELVVEYSMDNVIRTIKVGDKKGVTTAASDAKTYRVKFCNVPAKDDVAGGVAVTKTRPQMKYDETQEVAATSKNGKPINYEIMPVLKSVFQDVKLWDDFAGVSLDYRFNRIVTNDDIGKLVIAVQNLGYKVARDSNGDFTATKIGRTLNFHFKLGDLNTGRLELTY